MSFERINIPALVAPIAGDEPAGMAGIFEILDRLRADRKSIIMAMQEDPSPHERDWNRIVELAAETLESKSKHLQVAVRLVEGLARRDGYVGLGDGLKFLHSFTAECWERMYPEVDPSDPSVRADPFEYLNDSKAGALMPIFIKMLPMVTSDEGDFSWSDINAKDPQSSDRKIQDAYNEKQKQVRKAIEATSRKQIEILLNALKEGMDSLASLVQVLNDKIGRNDAPGMGDLRESMADCHRQLAGLLKDKGGATPVEEESTDQTGAEAEAGTEAAAETGETVVMTAVKKTTLTRADIYQRLSEAAALLEKMEPHSPIPYMIQRAVSLGSMPFPDLMRALITDANQAEELNRRVGVGAPK